MIPTLYLILSLVPANAPPDTPPRLEMRLEDGGQDLSLPFNCMRIGQIEAAKLFARRPAWAAKWRIGRISCRPIGPEEPA